MAATAKHSDDHPTTTPSIMFVLATIHRATLCTGMGSN